MVGGELNGRALKSPPVDGVPRREVGIKIWIYSYTRALTSTSGGGYHYPLGGILYSILLLITLLVRILAAA
jgi:hypothetical protein